MKITKITNPDFSEIGDLLFITWPKEFGIKSKEEIIREYERHFDPQKDVIKLAFVENCTAGWYRYTRWPGDDNNPHRAHTLDIGVLPEFRGRGVGKALFKEMLEDLKNKGFKEVLSRTFKTNEISINLHKAMGFREHGQTDDSIVWEFFI